MADDGNGAVFGNNFSNRAAEAGHDVVLLGGDDNTRFLGSCKNCFFVDGFDRVYLRL